MILPTQPKSIVIIGAGAIGIEFAYFFNAFGTKVTVVEMLPHILPVEDTEVSAAAGEELQESRHPHAHQAPRSPPARTDGDKVKTHRRRRGERDARSRRRASSPSACSRVLPGGIELKLTERG